MQSVGRFRQREGLCHNGLDSAGLKQRDDRMPGFLPTRLWLSKQREALDGGSFPDEICDVNACPAASRVTECCKTSARRKRSECLAQDVTRDAVYDDVCATTACDTSHPIAQLLASEVNDLVESERLCLLSLVMVGGA
jgi:hypothetical protein